MKIDIYTWEDDEGYKRQALYIDEVDGIFFQYHSK